MKRETPALNKVCVIDCQVVLTGRSILHEGSDHLLAATLCGVAP
jgi:hypothetical protein